MIYRMDTVRVEAVDGRQWKLLEPYDYMHSPTIFIRVPEDFITDFASIPRFLWRVLPPWDSHLPAALVHDWLYRRGELVDRTGTYGTPFAREATRPEADAIFLGHMQRLGLPIWKSQVIYRGVRIGGWLSWKQNRKH